VSLITPKACEVLSRHRWRSRRATRAGGEQKSVRVGVRFASRAHIRDLVPTSHVYRLADSSRFISVHSSQVRHHGINSKSRKIGVTDQISALRAMLFSGSALIAFGGRHRARE
jgi:hypothetical protein